MTQLDLFQHGFVRCAKQVDIDAQTTLEELLVLHLCLKRPIDLNYAKQLVQQGFDTH